MERYNSYAASKNTDLMVAIETLKSKIEAVDKGISNIVEVVVATGSTALADKLKELEADKKIYENALFDKEKELDKITVDKKEMKRAFKKAKNMLMSGILTNRKAIVENYVKQIIIYKDKITVEFNVMDNYSVTEEIYRC